MPASAGVSGFVYATGTTTTGVHDNGSGRSVATLTDGSSIITGAYDATVTFGTHSLATSSYNSVYVAKVDASGDCKWLTGVTGDAYFQPRGVTVLSDGSIMVTGMLNGTATFGETTVTGFFVPYIAKLDTNGNWLWVKIVSSIGGSGGYAVAAGPAAGGSAIVTGQYSGVTTFGGLPPLNPAAGGNTAFVAKIDANGDWVWAASAGGTGSAWSSGISVLPDGSSLVTGDFSTNAVFGALPALTGVGSEVFVAKVSPNGDWVWAVPAGGSGSDSGAGVSALLDGSSVVTGRFTDSAVFGALPALTGVGSEVFVAKVSPNGDWVWAVPAGGSGADSANGVSALPDGSSTVTGYFSGNATFGGLPELSGTAGKKDTFVARYLDLPQPPDAPRAVAGQEASTVSITPLAGGSVITYRVISDPGAATCTIAPPLTGCSVEGLSGGTSYRFNVTATNAAGTGPPSKWSDSVTPTAPPLLVLNGRLRCIAMTCTTTGSVPTGVTKITQSATTMPVATARELPRAKVKKVKARCAIKTSGKGAKKKRTYICTIRLSKGKWTIVTRALAKTNTIVAQSSKTKSR